MVLQWHCYVYRLYIIFFVLLFLVIYFYVLMEWNTTRVGLYRQRTVAKYSIVEMEKKKRSNEHILLCCFSCFFPFILTVLNIQSTILFNLAHVRVYICLYHFLCIGFCKSLFCCVQNDPE